MISLSIFDMTVNENNTEIKIDVLMSLHAIKTPFATLSLVKPLL